MFRAAFLGVMLATLSACSQAEGLHTPLPPNSTRIESNHIGQVEASTVQITPELEELRPTHWFVSRKGINRDGRAWATAWNELDQIDWSLVQPGDTILIDGGPVACPSLGADYGDESCGMVYNTPMSIDVNGTGSAPIVIRLASEEGRDGTAVIDGGVDGGMKCPGYPAESYPPESLNIPSSPGKIDPNNPIKIGIDLKSSEWVIIDGTKWGGIEIRNTREYGLSFNEAHNITAQYLKIHHVRGVGRPVLVFQRPSSGSNTLSHSELFASGQDVVHAAGDSFVMEYTYMHDNYCYHPDGVQSFTWPDYPDGGPLGEIRDLTIRYSIIESIGNLVDNDGIHGMGVFLGESVESAIAWLDGADIHDNLIVNVKDASIRTNNPSTTNIRIFRNTIVGTGRWAIQWFPGAKAPMEIYENVFYNNGLAIDGESFSLNTDDGETLFVNNCYYNDKVPMKEVYGDVAEAGTIRQDPLFVSESSGDYALSPESPCAGMGSAITSVETLIGLDTDRN